MQGWCSANLTTIYLKTITNTEHGRSMILMEVKVSFIFKLLKVACRFEGIHAASAEVCIINSLQIKNKACRLEQHCFKWLTVFNYAMIVILI